ncbi:MAG: AraC family transcriptional regulator [Proteobacteria bacterium]|nr:AraC family transcriptional regulator [Pseudomonadota bacterium]
MSIVRVEGSLFSRAEMTAPWGVSTRGAGDGIFHAVVAGAGQLEVEGEPTRSFRAGDLLVMPHGAAHVLRDASGSPVRHISQWPSEREDDGLPCLRGGGPGAPTSLLCGTFRFDAEGRTSLLPSLPAVIHVSGGQATGWLDSTLRHLADELASGRPGGAVLAARLADLLFVGVLRAWIEEADDATGWLAALGDPQLSRALGAIHGDAARSWTVAELAREAGMSRSGFFARFSERVGEPPAAYLTRWRMTVARAQLRRTSDPLIEVAERVGYGSEAAFSRAFKRSVGVPPATWRRAVRAA